MNVKLKVFSLINEFHLLKEIWIVYINIKQFTCSSWVAKSKYNTCI